MKIKILEVGLGLFSGSGLSVMAWELCRRMDYDRVQIDFATAVKETGDYEEAVAKNGGQIFKIRNTGNVISKKLNWYKQLKKIACEGKYDFIHIHSGDLVNTVFLYLSAKKCCNNVIIHSHAAGFETNSSKYNLKIALKNIAGAILKKCIKYDNSVFLACSDPAARWMFPGKVIKNNNYTVLKNGIESENFVFSPQIREKVRKELSLDGKFVIGHVGRFAYPKNHIFLLDIFNSIHRKNSDSVLLLAGDGELEAEIREKAAKLGLLDSIIFFGATEKVNELYQAMDCFVFPSHYEGLGIVAIEAQAAGLRTLCSDAVPGEAKITELIEYASLSDGADVWAERVLGFNNGYERKNMCDEIKSAGYDIKQSVKQLEDIYLGCRK